MEGREKSRDTISRSLSTEFGFCVIFLGVSQGGCLKIMLEFYPHILRGIFLREIPTLQLLSKIPWNMVD